MSQTTKIEWTDVSWNPTHGCSKVSAGCNHCYAETLSLRYRQTLKPWTALNAAENVLLKPHKLREPLSKAGPWKNPCRVFVNSMSDLFHEQIPDEYIARVFAIMAEADRHTFQVLTKRPERMRNLLNDDAFFDAVTECLALSTGEPTFQPRPSPNVWLGVSIENRKWVGRADVLRETPAAVRFISAEPLLGPLVYNWEGSVALNEPPQFADAPALVPALDLAGIDWLIVGGESGKGHRPFNVEWARDLRDACRAGAEPCGACHAFGSIPRSMSWHLDSGQPCPPHENDRCPHCDGRGWHDGTAFFVKQLGGTRPGTALEDLPADLQIREFPA